MPSKEDAISVLKKVKDPEIGLDLWTLGLIYDVTLKGTGVDIKMTLTSPMCPFGQEMMLEVKKSLVTIGFKEAKVELVFDPPWTPSDEVKAMLGV